MAYSKEFFEKVEGWTNKGIFPQLKPGDRVVEIGAQMLNLDIPHALVGAFIRRYNPAFDETELPAKFPVHKCYYSYASEIWKRCGMEYESYDIDQKAPDCTLFDLNFSEIPRKDKGRAKVVTNIGTSEHVANQLNTFKVAHDLMTVGGITIHTVPFSGWYNHALVNYHPKFFFSLIINNRYRLLYVDFSPPAKYSTFPGEHWMFDGDHVLAADTMPGSKTWKDTLLPSGMLNLVVQRRFDDEFVPPTDFTHGVYGLGPMADLSTLLNRDDLPRNPWAEAYRQKTRASAKVVIIKEPKLKPFLRQCGGYLPKPLRGLLKRIIPASIYS